MANLVYFDLETQKSAAEVGGWKNKQEMRMSIGVTYSTASGRYQIYDEARAGELIRELTRADRIIGFNILNFDYEVLHGYSPLNLRDYPTLDLMTDLESKLGHRLSLESVATATLGAPKIADGTQALRWWKEGNLLAIAEYCCFDVKITKELHEHGRAHGEVAYLDLRGQRRIVKVQW
jgi:DEAD/DEAH box helicase domain-containing protein